MNLNNFMLQLDYRDPFNAEEQAFYEAICMGLDRQLSHTAEWLKSDEAKEFYNNRQEYLNWIWENEIDLPNQLDNLINYNSSASNDEFISRFYHIGCSMGAEQLKRALAFTPADEKTLNFIRSNSYSFIKKLNNDVASEIRNTIFTDIAQGNSYQKTINKLREIPLKPVADGRISPDVRARMIARTERARARNYGTLQAYADYGVEEYDVITASDSRVCNICISIEEGNPYSLSDSRGYPPFHVNCYDKDTELFTINGWKKISDVTLNDKVLSLNPETEEMIFVKPTNVITGYAEELIHIHNHSFDLCVTEDHECFIHQRREKKGKKVFVPEFRKPNELNSDSYFVRRISPPDRVCPEYLNINGLNIHKKDFAFLMGWYLSEGSVLHNPETAKSRGYPIKITQMKPENRRIIQPVLERITESWGLHLAISKEYFEFYCKPLYDYLIQLGYSHEKYIPSEVFKLDNESLNIFLDNYIKGDGHIKVTDGFGYGSSQQTIFTSSKKMVNGLTYLIMLLGKNVSISIHSKKGTVTEFKNGVYKQNHNIYRLTILNSHKTQYRNCKVDKIKYNDFTYCVDVPPHHTILIKSKGKVSWSSNCRCGVAPHIGEKPLRNTSVDFPTSISDYVDMTMNPNRL